MEAEAPFVCDGVPARGAELLTGIEDPEVEQTGERESEFWTFRCAVLDGDGDTVLSVLWQTIEGHGWGAPQEYRDELSETQNAVAIEADAPGGGYVTGPARRPNGRWVCDDSRMVHVELFETVEGRDGFEDVARFVESLVPWTCGGEEFPEAEES
ncbi:hypothetical protein N868_08290 [Cellulomonas carbonis T26]|uniref:Uncharacterized protein n=1 Tax=Cellulomonas carbonis T26 TaxID=947969 RepID=A0A0A0BWW6_9CELL|nr:hypothetical protein N868_08290 [Cellulomonas carbonis T26]